MEIYLLQHEHNPSSLDLMYMSPVSSSNNCNSFIFSELYIKYTTRNKQHDNTTTCIQCYATANPPYEERRL